MVFKRGYITKSQNRVLKFVKEYIKKNKIPPSLNDISEGLGFIGNTAAADHLIILEREGYLTRIPKVNRGLVLIEKKVNIK